MMSYNNRVVNFHVSCMGSQNSDTSKECQFASVEGRASSPHGINIIFLSHRYGLTGNLKK